MVDKKIIIDGVDVSGCKYFLAPNGCDDINKDMFMTCECNANCYYKQSKRKEQECERLDNEAQNLFTEKTNLEIELDQLKVDNEELKKANEEKNELLAKLGCPTIATARMKAFTLEQQLEAYKMEAEEGKEINAELTAENEKLKRQHQADKGLITSIGKFNHQLLQEYDKLKIENDELFEVMNTDIAMDNVRLAMKISILKREVDQLKTENEELKRLIAKQKNAKIQLSKLKDKQYKEFCDMKQTLIEIKKFVENEMTQNSDTYIILQKISECED